MESVKWRDGEAMSLASVGDSTLTAEQWPRGSERWVSALWTGGDRQPICRYIVELDSPGHASREEAKGAAVEALRRWLDGGGR